MITKLGTETTDSYGLLGLLGLELTKDGRGQMIHWFFGVDIQLLAVAIIGLSYNLKLGFSNLNQ